MTKLLSLTWLASATLLAACSQREPAPAAAGNAAKPEVQEEAFVDAFDTPMDDYVASHKGLYELWEDRGDEGLMCELQLTDSRTIGGYAVEADEACLARIQVPDLFAWFIAPDDGYLVFIDATRQTLMRLKPDSNGVYYGNNEFYAIHQKR